MALRDPYRNFKFEVEITGFTRAGFNKVSGLKHDIEVIDYREGGENETSLKLPGQSKFDDVTLERGLSEDTDFVSWIEEVFNLDNAAGAQGSNEDFRRTVVIHLKDKSGTRIRKWTLTNAWPRTKEIGDLDAKGNDVLIDKITLANEGIKEEAE
jgi:phage tail-like protein